MNDKDVSLDIRFPQLLGKNRMAMSESTRRNRWAQWLRLARKSDATRLSRYWTDVTACRGCIHLRGAWCRSEELPCTINPYMTFRHGGIGMACMGGGYRTTTPPDSNDPIEARQILQKDQAIDNDPNQVNK